ncbi:MAG: PEP-CTERM sorting domain-containing protein [Phycisphaeraceae bacterium]
MKKFATIALTCLSIATQNSAQAELFGLFKGPSSNTSAQPFMIDPATGVVTAFGDAFTFGFFSSGVDATDPTTGRLFFSASALGETSSTRRIYTIDGNDGSNVQGGVLTASGSITSGRPHAIEYGNGSLYGIVDGGTERILASIDPITGAMTGIGSGFNSGGFSSGVSAIDPGSNTFYWIANGESTSNRNVFSIDTNTGAATSFEITEASGNFSTAPRLIEFDPVSGNIIAVLDGTGGLSGTDAVFTIDPTTGVATQLGSDTFSATYNNTVSVFDPFEGSIFHATALNGDASSDRRVLSIATDGTAGAGSPITIDVTFQNAPIAFGVVPEPTSLALLGLGGLLVARRRR